MKTFLSTTGGWEIHRYHRRDITFEDGFTHDTSGLFHFSQEKSVHQALESVN